VNRHDGGATLLKYPDRIFEIVSAVRAAVPATIPVSAKLRLGWDDMQAIHQNSEAAASGGATWIAIHGRTKVQGYTPPAYWKPIGEVRARLGIPVIANGEIWTLDDFKRCRDETQCKHYMLGRGALANPQLVTQIAVELGLLKKSAANDEEELAGEKRRWYPLLLRFAEISEKFANRSDYTACRIKQWLRIASHRRQITWFDEIKRLQGYQEILKWLA
jgi:tRNA-dihydrouridine synthase C